MKNNIQSDKILILGAKGILGQELAEVFNNLKPVLWDKENLDITDEKSVCGRIFELKPDIIINAAAYTAVDDCEINRDLAMKVNGEAVKYLMGTFLSLLPLPAPQVMRDGERQKKVPVFIHYSTDYVFDGNKRGGYQEDDEPRNPVNIYGESKFLGEKYIKRLISNFKFLNNGNFRWYIIRTSWLYGRGGRNFVDTISELLKKRDQIQVVNDQYGKPTYTYDLAIKTRELLEGDYVPGVYHITNETANKEKGISWYDFAEEIFLINREKIKGNKEITPCVSREFPRPAKRPKWSALLNIKLPLMRNWREALKDYLNG